MQGLAVSRAGIGMALAALGVATAVACGGDDGASTFDGGSGGTSAGGPGGFTDGAPPCQGLACNRVACGGGAKTTLSGTVYDPAGKVPLYGAAVYIPNGPIPPTKQGLSCETCGARGNILVSALTDTSGRFVLDDVPASIELPLVVEIGKWRRVVTVPAAAPCADNPVADRNLTRLPRSRAEGELPRIALVTGAADPLECLLRKIGLDDGEFGVAGGDERVHLYAGYGYDDGVQRVATSAFSPSVKAGAAFPDAAAFYSDAAKLAAYDILLLACEGYYNPDKKPNRQALVDFTSGGGRVFASHWHRYWFHDDTATSPFPPVATWVDRAPPVDPPTASIDGTVDVSFPKGAALRDWLVAVGASTTPGRVPIREAKHNVDAVDPTRAQTWISLANPLEQSRTAVEYLSFNTPVGKPAADQCGRVVYSGLHVSSGDRPGDAFPSGCLSAELSPQEKVLEFMLFDLSSCVRSDAEPPSPPR